MGAFEAAAQKLPCRQQEEKDGPDVPGEDHDIDGQMGEARGPSHQFRKERQVRVRHEELGAKGIQMGVGHALDGRDVDGTIVHAEVIAVHQDGQGCDGAQAGHGDLASDTAIACKDVLEDDIKIGREAASSLSEKETKGRISDVIVDGLRIEVISEIITANR